MLDPLIGHHAAQTVGAEQETVPCLRNDRIGQNGSCTHIGDSQTVRDLILAGMVFRLLFRDLAAIDQELNKRLIFRQLHDSAAPDQINAAVSDRTDIYFSVAHDEHHAG